MRVGVIRTSTAFVSLLAACSPEAPDVATWTGTVDTLANGAVHVTSPATGAWTPETAWRLEENLRIGSLDSYGPDMFGRIADLTLDPLGRVWVADAQAQEIRVFDGDGAWVRTVGRPGQGPGEFSSVDALRWGQDGNLWVVDQRNGRLSLFDTAGAFLASHLRRMSSSSFPWGGQVMADGSILDQVLVRTDDALVSHLARWRIDGDAIDTIPLPAWDQRVWVARSENGMSQSAVPFTPRLYRVLRPEGTLWFGTGDRYRIVVRDLATDDTLRIIERAFEPVPVTGIEKDSAIARMDYMIEQGADVDRGDIPDEKPAFSTFLVDDEGRLWVRPTVAADSLAQRRFDVFDTDGRFLGTVDSPVPFGPPPQVYGDWMIGVTRDELGVESVVRLRIIR